MRDLPPETAVAAERIAVYHRMFRRSKNVPWLWAAYRIWSGLNAFDSTIALPHWIKSHFDDVERGLQIAAEKLRPRKRRASWKAAALDALGLPRDPFHDFERTGRALNLAIAVRVLTDTDDPHKLIEAYRLVADRCDVSEATVRRAWKRYKTIARQQDLDEQLEWQRAVEGFRLEHARRFGAPPARAHKKARRRRSSVMAFPRKNIQ
jgi:hypothetical protein